MRVVQAESLPKDKSYSYFKFLCIVIVAVRRSWEKLKENHLQFFAKSNMVPNLTPSYEKSTGLWGQISLDFSPGESYISDLGFFNCGMEITFLGGSLYEFIERQGLQLLRHLPPAEEVMGGQPPSPHLGRDVKAGRGVGIREETISDWKLLV